MSGRIKSCMRHGFGFENHGFGSMAFYKIRIYVKSGFLAFQSSSSSLSSRISSMPSSPLSSPAEFASLFAPEADAASLLATETDAEVFADFPEGSSLPELSGSALRFLGD